MSNKKKGPIRLLSDEVVTALLPSLQSIGFTENIAFSEQGKWNGKAFVWQYIRLESDSTFTLILIAAWGGKKDGLVVDALSFELSKDHSDNDPISTGISALETRFFQRLLEYPLAIIEEVSQRPNIELCLFRFFSCMPPLLRKLLIPLKFVAVWGMSTLNTIVMIILFVFYVPFVGIANVTSGSSVVISGARQKRIVAKAAKDINAMFKDGLPSFLKRSIVTLD